MSRTPQPWTPFADGERFHFTAPIEQLKTSRATAGAMTFEGYASVFNTMIDAYVPTVIEPGAFAATLADVDQRRRLRAGVAAGRDTQGDEQGEYHDLFDGVLEMGQRGERKQFRAEEAGLYTVTVESEAGATLARQAIEIPEVDLEMERTARDMENLRQWATASQGAAVPAEEVGEPAELARKVKARALALASAARPQPAGLNALVLALLLLCLGGEWALRRKWGLR
jgi:hypothetical protein